MAGGIDILKGHVRMSLLEEYHMGEEDIAIACNDNKLSQMMLWHTAPDHDESSTSKSIPLRLQFHTHCFNDDTVQPGETKSRLISEEHLSPVLACPAIVGLCP